MSDVWGFDRERAERLKRIADETQPINRVNISRRRQQSAIGGGIVAVTPAGGIEAATLVSGVYNLGYATCALYRIVGTQAIATGESVVILNTVSIRVKGSTLIQAKMIDGEYCVDVESCSNVYAES